MEIASARSVRRHTLALMVVLGVHAIFAIALVFGTLIRPGSDGRVKPITLLPIDPEKALPPIVRPPRPPDLTARPVEFPPDTLPDVRGPGFDNSGVSAVSHTDTAPITAVLRITPAHISAGISLGDRCQGYYPSASRRLNEEGSVVVLIYVAADGRVTDTRIETSSGVQRLDEATVRCVTREGRFEPQRVGSDPVGSWQRMKYTWRLSS